MIEDLLTFKNFGEAELAAMRSYFAVTDRDLQRLADLRPFAETVTAEIVDRFYDKLLADPEARAFLDSDDTVSRLRRTQAQYFLRLFSGVLDLDYVHNRLRVGAVHERIGLPQHLYLGAYAHYLSLLRQCMHVHIPNPEETADAYAAIERLVFFDMALATDTYRAAADLRASREALARTEALRTLGQMAAVVAHEVKNPLASIAGVVQVIRTRFDAGSNEAGILDDLLARVRGLNTLVEDLLQFARPASSHRGKTRARMLVHNTVDLFTQNPSYGGVETSVAGDDVELEVDIQAVQRVLLNLMLNAAQAMEGHGKIHVGTRVDGGHCVISVKDNGPGISPEHRERIFEPFYTSKTRGTGLGLPIARRMIEAHGGSLTFECPADGGTVFAVALPLKSAG